MATAIVSLVIGLALLTAGGELLVRGASGLAAAARLSPLFIGLTVVAFGTSSPELVVSISTALSGQAEIALGNVIGSNIFNVLFILGLSALAAPLAVKSQLVRWDVPVMIGVSALVLLLSLDGRLTRIEGAGLLAGLFAYLAWAYRMGRQPGEAPTTAAPQRQPVTARRAALLLLNVLLGLGLLVGGCELFVRGAVTLAQLAGLSQVVIGLTIVAAGTSLPELATSLVASLRGERDIAVGNVVGSNLFNLLGVLGSACAASPTGMAVSPAVLRLDLPVMLAAAVLCLPVCFTGLRINRWEGALLLASYVVYTSYLLLR